MEEHEEIRRNVNMKNSNLINRAVHVHNPGRREKCKIKNNYSRNTNFNKRCFKNKEIQLPAQELNNSPSVNSFVEFLNKNAYQDTSVCNINNDRFQSDDMPEQFPDTDEKKPKDNNQYYTNCVINNLKKRLISDSKSNINSKRHGTKDFTQRCICNKKVSIKNIQSEKYINDPMQKNIRLKSMINRLAKIRRKEIENRDTRKWDNHFKNSTDIVNPTHKPILIKLEKPQKHINNLAKGDHRYHGLKTRENSICDWLSNSLIVYSEESDMGTTHHDNSPKRIDVIEIGEYHRLTPSTTRIFYKRDVNSVSSTIIVCSDKKLIAPKNLLNYNDTLSGCRVDTKTIFKHKQRRYKSFENDKQENNSEKYLLSDHKRSAIEKEMNLCSAELKKEICSEAVSSTSHTTKENVDVSTTTGSDLKLENKCSQFSETKRREWCLVKIDTKLDMLIKSVHAFIREVKSGRLSFEENKSLLKSEIGSQKCKNIITNGDVDVSKTNKISSIDKINVDYMNNKSEYFEQDYEFSSEKNYNQSCDINKEFAHTIFRRKGDEKMAKDFVITDNKTYVQLESNDKTVQDNKNAIASKFKDDKKNKTNIDSVKDVFKKQFKNKASNTHALNCYALLHIILQTVWTLMKEFSSIFYNSSLSRLSPHNHSTKYRCDLCDDIFPTSYELRRHMELHTVERMR